jgi:hypothetical protein
MLKTTADKSDVPPALANRRGWEYFDQKLTALRVNDVENILERGRLLSEAGFPAHEHQDEIDQY